MALIDVIEDVVSSLAADGLSPFPGFFTLMTIAGAVQAKGWEGKGEKDEFDESKLSRRQVQEIKRILDENFERQKKGTKSYYGKRKRYQARGNK